MFRVRIPLIAAVVVGVVTGACAVWATSTLNDAATSQVRSQVEHAEQSLRRSDRLDAVELTNEVANLAREDEFGQIFTKANETDRRSAAFVAADTRRARIADEAAKAEAAGHKNVRKPAIIAVVGADGKIVARDQNPNSNYGDDLKAKYPAAISAALGGAAVKDLWNFDNQMYRVGVAPIYTGAKVTGALVVGYVQSVEDAKAEKERLGSEVAYFLDGKVHASSFAQGGGGEGAEEKGLAEQLFGNKKADSAVKDHKATDPFIVKINGNEWLAVAAPFDGNVTASQSGFVVLASLTAAKSAGDTATTALFLLGLVGVIIALGASVFTARRFLTPLDKVEAGVAEVINGNRDYVFESPSPDYEGLANGLNVMLARLLGRPEPGEEDEGGGGDEGGESNGDRGDFAVEEAAAAGGEAALAAEPADTYYDRVYSEYVAAREKTGEGTDGLTAEVFIAKLKQNEVALAKQHGARLVRFKVQVKGNRTILKPVPIK